MQPDYIEYDRTPVEPRFDIQGVYFTDPDGSVRHRIRTDPLPAFTSEDPLLPVYARIEHLDYRVVRGVSDETSVRTLFAGNLHPDEERTSRILHSLMWSSDLPRIETYNMHSLASFLGQREYVVQVDGSYASLPDRERILFSYGQPAETEDTRTAKGRRIDMNRQFTFPDSAGTFDEIMKHIEYPAARMALTLVHDHPTVRTVASFHEDYALSDGFYLYDCPAGTADDRQHGLILDLLSSLRRTLAASGFAVYTGIDDPDDPDLGYYIDRGYVYQPNVSVNGTRRKIVTFEGAAVELGRLGASGVTRSFTFEIPMQMQDDRKSDLIAHVLNDFLIPYVTECGSGPH